MKILIVEDEAILAIELKSILQDLGHEVVGVAATSAEALRISDRTACDLALVDIHLSDGPTGPIVARKIADERKAAVLFTTSNPSRIPGDFANAFGALAKPYSDSDVKLAIDYITACMTNQPAPKVKPRTLTLAPATAQRIGASLQ